MMAELLYNRVTVVKAIGLSTRTMPAQLYAMYSYMAICFVTCCIVEAALVCDLFWRVCL